jgi:hypothetical protein
MATDITVDEAYQVISKAENLTQTIKFTTRGSGKERCMIFRVTGSDVNTGETLPIRRVQDDIRLRILTVWDLEKKDFRRINLETVFFLIVGSKEYNVIP